MLGLWLENRQLTLRHDLPVPRPRQDEALIRVRLAGVCGTDLELTRGYLPFTGIPGHELVGTVIEAPARSELVGARVVSEINIACRSCTWCAAGRPRHCQSRRVIGIRHHDGAFAEYLTAPLENLHQVPETVPDELAVLTEPLAAARVVLDQARIVAETRVLLIGAGRLGQLIARAVATTGCRLTVLARHQSQLQRLGSVRATIINESDAGSHGCRAPEPADVVIEASGSPDGLQLALDRARPRGTIVLKTTTARPIRLDLTRAVVNEVTIVGSRCGRFEPAMALLEHRAVDPSPLISRTYALEDGIAAFEAAAAPGAGKILLEP